MAGTGKPSLHTDMLVYLTRAFGQEQLDTMKSKVMSMEFGGFLSGELEKLPSMQKLLEKMEHKGVFKVKNYPQKIVDYRKLKELLQGCNCGDQPLEKIASTEDELAKLGYHVERGDQADSYVPMETDRSPLNVNNSRCDRSDAIPSGFNVADSGGGDTSDGLSYAKGKGYLLFVNLFENSGKPRRTGSEKDKDNIEALFEDILDFKCSYEKDLTKPQLMKLLQKTRTKLAKGNFSSFFLIICSHGEQFVVKENKREATVEGIVTIEKEYITEEELTKPFLGDDLKELYDKPKVFIIQACRAPRADKADDMESTSTEESLSDETSPASFTKPVNADMLVSYATTKGTKAWRDENGTWYISQLCKAIKKYSKTKHLYDILVRVNHAIAQRESSEGGAKQMPCQISTLTKDFWLS